MIDGEMGEPEKRPPQVIPLSGVVSDRPDLSSSSEESPEQFRRGFAATLRALLKENGFPEVLDHAATELSLRLNHKVSPSGAGKWLSAERMPAYPTLVELAQLLRVSVDRLLRGEESMWRIPPENPSEGAVERAEKLKLVDQLVMLPRTAVFDAITAEKKIVAFSRSWVTERFPGVMLQDIDKMTAQGDHMDPWIRQGDEVVFWTAPRFFEDNGVYVLQVGHNRMLRRIRQRVTGEFEISCENPRYQPELVPSDTFTHPLNLPGAGPLRVVGKVLAVIAFGR